MLNEKHEDVLREALSKDCPSKIPRSGESGANIDCFSVFYEPSEIGSSILITGISEQSFKGLSFNSESRIYDIETTMLIADCDQEHFHITHYHGLDAFDFATLEDFRRGRLLRWVYIKNLGSTIKEGFLQALFNKKKLADREHIKLLKFLYEQRLSGVQDFGSLGLLTMLHTSRWYGRPDSTSLRVSMRNRLELLKDAGLLKNIANGGSPKYQLTGRVIHAIEHHNNEERRHWDNLRIQGILVLLTVGLVVAALIEAFKG